MKDSNRRIRRNLRRTSGQKDSPAIYGRVRVRDLKTYSYDRQAYDGQQYQEAQ
jgi:hypothetical protein